MKESKYPPMTLLSNIFNDYPRAWELMEDFHNSNGKDLPEWNKLCYAPMAAAYAVITRGEMVESIKELKDIQSLTALAPWRLSKEVFVIDPDLANMLYDQTDNDVPSEIFYNLPYPCFYVELNQFLIGSIKISGMFVHMEHDPNNDDKELRLLFIDKYGNNVFAIPFHIDKKSINENFLHTANEAKKNLNLLQKLNDLDNMSNESINLESIISKALQLVLYICATNCEIAPHSEQSFITKRSERIRDRYAEIRKWTVGVRIGNSIRNSKNYKQSEESEKAESGSTKRPHARRGHWHHYWTGSRNSERTLILKWVAPTYIGLQSEESPVVIHNLN